MSRPRSLRHGRWRSRLLQPTLRRQLNLPSFICLPSLFSSISFPLPLFSLFFSFVLSQHETSRRSRELVRFVYQGISILPISFSSVDNFSHGWLSPFLASVPTFHRNPIKRVSYDIALYLLEDVRIYICKITPRDIFVAQSQRCDQWGVCTVTVHRRGRDVAMIGYSSIKEQANRR